MTLYYSPRRATALVEHKLNRIYDHHRGMYVLCLVLDPAPFPRSAPPRLVSNCIISSFGGKNDVQSTTVTHGTH